jgi:hypothetical protein
MEVNGQFQYPAVLPLGKNPGTHCIGGWVGPKSGLDVSEYTQVNNARYFIIQAPKFISSVAISLPASEALKKINAKSRPDKLHARYVNVLHADVNKYAPPCAVRFKVLH